MESGIQIFSKEETIWENLVVKFKIILKCVLKK